MFVLNQSKKKYYFKKSLVEIIIKNKSCNESYRVPFAPEATV